MAKSKLQTTKVYTVTLTGNDSLHKIFYETLKRWLFIEKRKVAQSEIEVRTIA